MNLQSIQDMSQLSDGIYELSFRTLNPLESLPFISYQISLAEAIPANAIAAKIGRIARQLSQSTRQPVIADTQKVLLLSPTALESTEEFNIIATDSINLIDLCYRGALNQLLNTHTANCFRNSGLQVNEYDRKAYIRRPARITTDIEAQRFIRWSLRLDEANHIILAIDYGNQYQDCLTLGERNLDTIQPGQSLIDIYDHAHCRFAGITNFLISDKLASLGNKSLLDYHRQAGKISEQVLNAIPPDTPAIEVAYGAEGKPKVFNHIPHLLKKSFRRDDLDSSTFNERVWNINTRFDKAKQRIEVFNSSADRFLFGQDISFSTIPYKPEPQFSFPRKDPKNLDFGRDFYFAYPSLALKQHKLLEKPEQINAIVLYPEGWEVSEWCRRFQSQLKSFGINLNLSESAYRSYKLESTLGMKRQVRNLEDYELALLFVPDRATFQASPELDPYPIFKRAFIDASLPSQAIEQSTLRSGFNAETGYNILLGILSKMGYSPWQLRNMPGDAEAFLGLDVGRKNGRAVGASAFIVNRLGKVIGWSAADFQANRETFDERTFRRTLFDLIGLFDEIEKTRISHIVIHRDGKFQPDEMSILQGLMPELQREGVKSIDVAEIIKSGYDRAGQYDSKSHKWSNPRRGWSWPIADDEAAIMTTGASEMKGSRNFVPRPITIRRRLGDTRLGILAAQAYWLSEMHIGSTQTVRLPITTYYADAAATAALENLIPTGMRVDCKLPFI